MTFFEIFSDYVLNLEYWLISGRVLEAFSVLNIEINSNLYIDYFLECISLSFRAYKV